MADKEVRLIDANDVIERLDMICDAGGCLSPVTKAVRKFCKGLINRQPTIEAQPVKHGKWLCRIQKDGTTVGQHNVRYCSECGYVIFTKTDTYCASCGARMDGDSEEE